MQHEIICVFQHGQLWEQYEILHSLNKAEVFLLHFVFKTSISFLHEIEIYS